MSSSVKVASLPDCDFCKYVSRPTNKVEKAGYDGKTTEGPWANMCEAHFKKYGVGLGTGKGQKLVLAEVK